MSFDVDNGSKKHNHFIYSCIVLKYQQFELRKLYAITALMIMITLNVVDFVVILD